MDIFTTLHTRRSIRRFTDAPVDSESVNRLLDAAMIAPSAGNARPWQFVVVDDKAVLAEVPGINKYAAMAPEAPLGIVVCGDLDRERYKGFWVQDCSAAVQNILLAATGLGLGAVWTGIYPEAERVAGFQKLLQLPERIIPLALVVVGHPAQQAERAEHKSRFEPELVHRNRWGAGRDNGA